MTYDRSIPTQAEIEALSRELMELHDYWSLDILHRAALMIARLELAYLSASASDRGSRSP